MFILAIETSCDETAVAIIKTNNKLPAKDLAFLPPDMEILSNIVSSQTKIHAHWGGVVPSLAKREHEKNLVPIFVKAMRKAGMFNNSKVKSQKSKLQFKIQNGIQKILNREQELLKQFTEIIPNLGIPPIDAIAVTVGPGLEPALWVGLNFAKALAVVWNKPLIPVNHLEGHIFSVLLKNNSKAKDQKSKLSPYGGSPEGRQVKKTKKETRKTDFEFPAICLLVSGGHTELILMRDWLKYEIVGQTRDDAAGECFDKAARVLGLPYPGGPQISIKAEEFKNSADSLTPISLPRPMINSGDFDFSFSGLKTAVLYKARDLNLELRDPGEKNRLAQEFCHEIQQSVIDVLISKTIAAAKKYEAKSVILCGGVSANKELRRQFKIAVKKTNLITSNVINLMIPEIKFSGDNAAMIGAAAGLQAIKLRKIKTPVALKADGNLQLKQNPVNIP